MLDDGDRPVPHPGLGQIDELAAKAREAGLDIKRDHTIWDTTLPLLPRGLSSGRRARAEVHQWRFGGRPS